MATATLKTEVKVTGVTLNLTQQEAQTLFDITRVVGGVPFCSTRIDKSRNPKSFSRRAYVANIREALEAEGFKDNDQYGRYRADDLTGELYFSDSVEEI